VPVARFPLVGERRAPALCELGVARVGDVLLFTEEIFAFCFGSWGRRLYRGALGEDAAPVRTRPGTGERFSSGSYAVGLSFGMKIIDRFSFGLSVKYVYEYIWETNASTYAFDFGSVYMTDFHNMRIGMRLANFGAEPVLSAQEVAERIKQENIYRVEVLQT
jgi:hypothetical protein